MTFTRYLNRVYLARLDRLVVRIFGVPYHRPRTRLAVMRREEREWEG